MSNLLDFLFEINQKGITKPLIIAGGFGLFLKQQYITERNIRTLFDDPLLQDRQKILIFSYR
jgi:hypothetical protein